MKILARYRTLISLAIFALAMASIAFTHKTGKKEWQLGLLAMVPKLLCDNGKTVFQECFDTSDTECRLGMGKSLAACMDRMNAEIPDNVPSFGAKNLALKVSQCAQKVYFEEHARKLKSTPTCQNFAQITAKF